MSLKAIFLDVGGTLAMPDYSRTLQPLMARGIHPTGIALGAAEKAAKFALDAQISQRAQVSIDGGYWNNYYTALLHDIGLTDEELKGELIALARTSSNWSRLADGADNVLRELACTYHLGIISNSDGSISQLLAKLGIADLFDCITDSGVVGHEKPDARIFAAALARIGVLAQEAVYIGDIYSVDYMGAKAVGMRAILMDAAGVYRNQALPRMDSIRQLPGMLRGFNMTSTL